MARRMSRSGVIALVSFVTVLAIGFAGRPADAPGQPGDPTGAHTQSPGASGGSGDPGVGGGAAQGPAEDLDAAMPECAPHLSRPAVAHPRDLNNAPVENCDIRETDVQGPLKQPVDLPQP
jgi:hypothetical protein